MLCVTMTMVYFSLSCAASSSIFEVETVSYTHLAASGSLTADKARGRLSTVVEMLLVNVQPHAPELLLKLLRRALG